MTNFYEKLNIDRNIETYEINEELIKQESVWKKREITSPEKATTMLALIIQAKKVFETDSSRREYDVELEKNMESEEQTDTNVERRKALEEWRDKAYFYYCNSQYDLAKVAIEKALFFSDMNNENDSFYALTSDIYRHNYDYQKAMNYINEAILISPEVSMYYVSKGLIFESSAIEIIKSGENVIYYNYVQESRKQFQIADAKCEQYREREKRANVLGLLANSYYYIKPIDAKLGETFAKRSIELGGDLWGYAYRILERVRKRDR